MEIKKSSGPSDAYKQRGRWSQLKTAAIDLEPCDPSRNDGWQEIVLDNVKTARSAQASLYTAQTKANKESNGDLGWRFQIAIEKSEGKRHHATLYFRKVSGSPRSYKKRTSGSAQSKEESKKKSKKKSKK